MILGLLTSGMLVSVVTCILISNFNMLDKATRLYCTITYILLVFAVYSYVGKNGLIILLVGIAAGLICYFAYSKFFTKSSLYKLMILEKESSEKELLEDDFMSTRKGKIVTVIVAVLVVYAIVSTFCILKLNSKINSMVSITNSLIEENNK